MAGLLTACATNTGNPSTEDGRSASSMPGSTTSSQATIDKFSWMATSLPSSSQLSQALGRQVRAATTPPIVGDESELRDTLSGSRIARGLECVGVVSMLEKRAYDIAPVRAVAYANASSATFGFAVFGSIDEASATFAAAARAWESCKGESLVKDDQTYRYTYRISDVVRTADVVSAVDHLTTDSPTGVPVTSARAIGWAERCVAESEVQAQDAAAPESSLRDQAAALVEITLEKLRISCR